MSSAGQDGTPLVLVAKLTAVCLPATTVAFSASGASHRAAWVEQAFTCSTELWPLPSPLHPSDLLKYCPVVCD